MKTLPMIALGALLAPLTANADPCGMVIASVEGADIERTGEQRTYVFYKDGIESIAIRFRSLNLSAMQA